MHGLERSPREEKGYALQYSGLENSMDCIVHGVAKSQTQLNNFYSLVYLQQFIYSLLFAAFDASLLSVYFYLAICPNNQNQIMY